MNKITDIEEIIADAKAEEEVKQAMEADYFKPFEAPRNNSTVTISLAEYEVLLKKSYDLERLLGAVLDDLELSYDKERLRIYGDRTLSAVKILYPAAYDSLLVAEQARAKEEEEDD